MATYNLDQLGHSEFEQMCQSLLKEVIGSGTITFGDGPDGGRDATFCGKAPYPSQSTQWEGNWIFQAKFHDTRLIGQDRARQELLIELDAELDKIACKYRRKCDNYIMITNVALSAYPERGTLDRITTEVKPKYVQVIPNIAVWGRDDVCRFLDMYPGIRTAYRHLITAGDVLSDVMQIVDEARRFVTFATQQGLPSALMPVASESDIERLVWGETGHHFSFLNGVGAAVPPGGTDPNAFIVDRHEKDTLIAKLKKSINDGARPRVVLVGSPMTGKSVFLYLMAKAWVRGGNELAFLIGDELSLADHHWLASHPQALVLVDQQADVALSRSVLKQLHRAAQAIILASRPGEDKAADEVFDSVYLPQYLYSPGVRGSVTCHLSAGDPEFVSEVVRLMASQYEVPLSPEAESSLTHLLFGMGPIESKPEAALGIAKAFFVAAREWRGPSEARARLSPDEVTQLAASLLEHARDQESPSQAVLTALFGKLPEHLRRLTLVLRFLRSAFGEMANTYHAEALTAAWYVYYGTPVDEMAVEDALSVGIINVHRYGKTGRPYYALRHLWQLEVLHDKISDARQSELLAALMRELEKRIPALGDPEDRAAVLYDLAFLYWENATQSGRREAARLYVQSRSIFNSITGRIAIDELCRNMLREVVAPPDIDTAIDRLQEFLSYLDIDGPAAYESKVNILSSFRAVEECATKHLSSPVKWRDQVEQLARVHLFQKSGDKYWQILYHGSSISKALALQLDQLERKQAVERLVLYYKGLLDEMGFAKVLAIAVSFAIVDATQTASNMFARIEEIQDWFFPELSSGQQAYYYSNVTWLLFQRVRAKEVPPETVAHWIDRFSVCLSKLGGRDRTRLFAICLASAANSAADSQDGENPVCVIDDVQVRLLGNLEDKGRYYSLALAVVADGSTRVEDRYRFRIFLATVWQRLADLDKEFASQLTDHLAAWMASRNFTIHCLANAAADLSDPEFASRPLAHRMSSVQSFISETAALMGTDSRDLVAFVSLSASSILRAVPRTEAVVVWLPSLSTQATDWIHRDPYKELFWRTNTIARYYGSIIGRLILAPTRDPMLVDEILDHVATLEITDDRRLIETLSYALEHTALQLVNVAAMYPDREKWPTHFETVIAAAVRWFDPKICEANGDLIRLLIATSVLSIGLHACYQPEDAQDATGGLINVARAYSLDDGRFGAILARGLEDLAPGSRNPSDTQNINRLSILESYSATTERLVARCHDLGDRCSSSFNIASSDRTQVVEFCNAMRDRLREIRAEFQLFQPRMPEIDAFETAVDSFLSEWDWEFENLAKAVTSRDQELLEEVMRRWSGERPALWTKMMDLIPPVPLVPPLAVLASDALATSSRTA